MAPNNWKNAISYPKAPTAKRVIEDTYTAPAWKCHECWKRTKVVLPPQVGMVGKNFKRQVNSETKRSALATYKARMSKRVPMFALRCYKECET